jgi:hypothetical protein
MKEYNFRGCGASTPDVRITSDGMICLHFMGTDSGTQVILVLRLLPAQFEVVMSVLLMGGIYDL